MKTSLLILFFLTQTALGLVYTGGVDHATAPTDDPGWNNVGIIGPGSGIYLGDGWVISPYHVYRPYIDLDQTYYEIPGTSHRIKYNDSINTDLIMFRINGNPNLPLIEIYDTTPVSDEVTIIATGRSRYGDLVQFDDDRYQGYNTTSSRAKRWGRNITGLYTFSTSSVFGRTSSFMTSFDLPGLGDDECQLVNNDSGGGVFIKYGESWELAGLALAVGGPYSYSGNITTAPVYGSYTKYADMATYKSQIDIIRSIPLEGDADWDGDVDADDFDVLLSTFGSVDNLKADFNNDNKVDLKDFTILRTNFGMISGNGIVHSPEPSTILMLFVFSPLLYKKRKRK